MKSPFKDPWEKDKVEICIKAVTCGNEMTTVDNLTSSQ